MIRGGSRSAHRDENGSIRNKRLEIQGLRAVAVVAVVANHLSNWPRGGFVGVDVFFVISGYLITGRLLRTAPRRSAGGYFRSFYGLRVRRILPAGLLFIVLTVIASWMTYDSTRAHDIFIDGLWSAAFAQNWHLASLSTNYFHFNDAVSPLQHYWSLSVEEQFYIVWPILLLGMASVMGVRRRRESSRAFELGAGLVALVISTAAFLYGIQDTRLHPAAAYFSTFDRVWELGIGAVLACAIPHLSKIYSLWSEILAWIGLALIAVALFVTPSSHGFPVPWAIIAVAGSALVLAAGALSEEPLEAIVLTNPVSTFLGDISYSIYLVHFPLVVILGTLMPGNHAFYYAVVLLGTLGLSTLSFYFVEEPARAGRFDVHPDLSKKAVPAFVALTLAVAGYTVRPQPPLYTDAELKVLNGSGPSLSPTTAVDPTVAQPSKTLGKELIAALGLVGTPKITHPRSTNQRSVDWAPCSQGTPPQVRLSCVYTPAGGRDPKKVVLVVGDSIVLSFMPLVRAALVPHGWTVVGYARQGCGAQDADELLFGAHTIDHFCSAEHAAYPSILDQVKPTLVLITSLDKTVASLVNPSPDAYERGMLKTIKLSKAPGRHVVVLSPNPQTGDPSTCFVAGVQTCSQSINQYWWTQRAADRQASAAAHTAYLDTSQWFCVDDLCPAVVGSTQTTYDGIHTTPEYATELGPELFRALQSRHLL